MLPIDKTPTVTRRGIGLVGAAAAVALAAPARIGHAQPAVIRVGNIQALTGPSAPYGIRARDGGLLTLEDINSTGLTLGGTTYRLEMSVDDMANDARQAITLMRQYASDPAIVAVIAPSNSVGYVPLVAVSGQLQVVTMATGSGAPIPTWNMYAYRLNPVSATAVPAMMRKVVPKERIKRLAVVYDQTQDAQKGDAEVARRIAGELGCEVVAFEAFRAGDQDVSPQAAKVRASRPDGIYLAAATGDGVRVASQLREAGIDSPMMTGFGSFQDPVYWDGTNGQIKGCYTWLGVDLAAPGTALKPFLDHYTAKFPQGPTSFSVYGSDALITIVAALKKAGKADRTALAEALSSISITTPVGSAISFSNPPTGENQTPSVVVVQVTGRGTYVSV